MGLITLHWFLDVIVVFLSMVVLAYFYMTRNFNYWPKRNVTEVPPKPFFGNFLDCCLFRQSASGCLNAVYQQAKGLPYIGFYIFDKPALMLRDPEINRRILIKDFSYFVDRYAKSAESDPIGSANLFLLKNPAWKSLRHKITPIFTSGKIRRMFHLMLAVGEDLDTHLSALQLEGNGNIVEAKEIAVRFTTDVIASCAFGLRANCLNHPKAEFRQCGRSMFEFTYKRGAEFAAFFFIPRLVTPLNLKFFSTGSSDFMRKVFTETFNTRMTSDVRREDLIDLLIQLKQSDSEDSQGFKLEGDTLVGQAAVFFAAGFETSSSTLSFALYELALHPDIQSKLREEITSALANNGGKITYEMVLSLEYLDQVVSETLRKYPSVPFLDRVANTDYKLPESGLVIERGTPVYISLLGLHYDPEYYPEPDKFDPERFTEANKAKRPAFTYLPFGDGPRNCIGLRFGQLQVKLGILKFVSNYELSACDETMIPLRFNPKSLLAGPDGGLFLRARKIDSYLIFKNMLSPRPDLCLNHKMVFFTSSWILSAAILFFTALVLAYFYMTRNFNHWKNKGVTEVTPIPFVGNFGQCLLFRLSVFEYLAEIYKWGQGLPYVGFYIFDKPALVLRDPEVIKSVLLKDFQNLPNRHGTASSKDFTGNNNLFLIKNPDWKNLRYKLTSVFSSGKMKAMFPLVNAVGDDLATYFEHLNLEGEGQVLELKEICAKYTTDVIGTCVYGLQVNSLANPNAEFRKYGRRMFDFTWKRGAELMAVFFIPGITNFFGSMLFEGESSNFMKKVFWETLTTRMQTGLKRNDLIDLLIELRNNQKDDDLFQFTDENMVAQAAIFFAAGFETSSTLVSFTLHELSLQPELQTKLREEILTALEESDGKLSYDLVQNLPYLAKVAWETLRKYPSVPFLDREAICDYTIPKTGLLIKKGTPVYIPLVGLHYDPEYYSDPVKYDPERFSEENKKKRPAFTYLPFGEGPRNCIGLRFGLMQAKIGLIKILSKFEVSPCNKTLNPMRVDPKALTYSSDGGLFHRVRRITTTAG
ncbi:uncharacterized protein LOC124180747 [Neodiprion fabricii]|uniref:uncharacterized protein LOC124180747 n=1 Tax=Neodiprion fabricii TaxID=2872261 RepID=UPI001ED900DB|nr:uncharacterized protein LOC124180747 [Neodiprion fabricii]